MRRGTDMYADSGSSLLPSPVLSNGRIRENRRIRERERSLGFEERGTTSLDGTDQ